MTDKQCEKMPNVTVSTVRTVRDTWVSEVVDGKGKRDLKLNITDNWSGAL